MTGRTDRVPTAKQIRGRSSNIDPQKRNAIVDQFMDEGGRDEEGAMLLARSMLVDITDRVLAERERARLQEQNIYPQEEIKSVHNFEQIIGRSSALLEVLGNVGRVASTMLQFLSPAKRAPAKS